jgi:Ca-activated chloride channel family protein
VIRGAMLGAALAAALLQPTQDQIARFRSTSDAVRVDVLVSDRNRPVSGLQANDFELRDSGVIQSIEAVSIEDVPVTLMLALDTSSSVAGPMLEQLKEAAQAALASLRPDDHVALLTFSDRVVRAQTITRDRRLLSAAIDRMTAAGATSLRDAVYTATALRERAPGRVVLLLFTDGVDTMSWLTPNDVLDAAVRSDMVMYAISTSETLYHPNTRTAAQYAEAAARLFRVEPESFPHGFIVELTDRTGGSVLFVQKTTELAAAFSRIVAEFKSRYLLTYSPRGVPSAGWHPLEVSLKNRRGQVTARRGYWR